MRRRGGGGGSEENKKQKKEKRRVGWMAGMGMTSVGRGGLRGGGGEIV